MAGMPQPDPKQQLDPAHPVAPSAPNQTSSIAPGFEAAQASDPGWAARVALNQKLNPPVEANGPPSPNIPFFSRALPSNGAPTPTFAPPASASMGQLMANPKAGLALLHGITPEHAAGAQALAGVPISSPSAIPPPPATVEDAQARLSQSPAWSGANAPPQPGSPEHMVANHHLYTDDDFVKQFAGMSRRGALQMMAAIQPPSPQEQAMHLALQGAAKSGEPGAVQKILNMFAFGNNPSLMYNPELLNIGAAPKSPGAVDPNVAE